MIRLALSLLILILSTGCSTIGGWFGGSDNSIPPAALKTIDQPVGVQQLWETQIGSGAEKQFIRLTPALVDGRVYAASHDGTVTALDALSGQRLWETSTNLPISGGVGVSGNGLVLAGTSKGEVIALRQENGQEAWHAQVSSEVLAPPRAASGIVVIRTVDGKFTGLDADSGEQRWVFTYAMPALSLRGNAPPVVTRDLVIAGLDSGKLLVLALTKGLPLTEKTVAIPRGRTEIERLIDIDSEPKVFADTLYLAAYRGNIAAIDMHSGNLLWNRDISSYAGLDVDARQVYTSDDTDAVLALDRATGSTFWKQTELTGRRLSAPVVTTDHVVVGDFEGYLHWMRKEDGRIVGRLRAASKAIVTPPVAIGDIVFIQGQGGTLGAFRAGS
ncbi:MAG TPA: outer membrane protein assembly factor BamB [Candidatus Competibacteraceae bacterium]|nr:outer membrane protein assembly factor BamB [Gammaproteobacteria bacterium]HPF59428.1 outer membrane protein assembly factor BamB [Candidatus Competibacteraceae bacterium]HRY18308.1 outer membrane protein assembly factor BamB [Candidatus Competibacteraceae bacterium]